MHPRYKHARSLLVMEQPFFATILLHLRERECGPEITKTMGVDGKTLFVNPEFVEKLTLDETVGVLIHEVCHVIFMHHLRMAEMERVSELTGRSHGLLWNIATDFAINLQLDKEDIKLPAGGLLDTKWEGMHAEEIYEALLASADKNTKKNEGGILGDVMPGVNEQGQVMTENEQAVARMDTESLIIQAARTAQQIGRLPGFAKVLLDQLTESRVDWREALWSFISTGVSFGFNWTKPNRRYHDKPYILPSFGAKGMPALNCIIDTSGSVSDAELQQFMAEVRAATEAYGISDVVTVMCDTHVEAVYEHCANDGDLVFEAVGRGGTDMNPAFDLLRERRPAPTILFSDMEIPPIRPYNNPTIFCRCGGPSRYIPDWGPVIDV